MEEHFKLDCNWDKRMIKTAIKLSPRVSLLLSSSLSLSLFLILTHPRCYKDVSQSKSQTRCTFHIYCVCNLTAQNVMVVSDRGTPSCDDRPDLERAQAVVWQCEQGPTPGKTERTVKDVAWCVPRTKGQIQPTLGNRDFGAWDIRPFL